MKYLPDVVYKTKSGLFVRQDENPGLLVFSQYTGLIFVVHPKDINNTISWMNFENRFVPQSTIRNALGVGWDKEVKNGTFPMPHYLKGQGKWNSRPWPKRFPIVINWLLTGNCPLACKYCDAEDLMRQKRPEPDAEDTRLIASRILSYNPLVVVLSGGEPLLSPHLEECIKLLYPHTGIIVDTSGLYLDEEKRKLFKKYQVVVRLSIDSPIPKYNDGLRCFSKKRINHQEVNNSNSSLKNAIQSLCLCLDENLTASVQTVATRNTINDLPSFGERLFSLGVRSWRIHLVSLSKDNINYKRLFVPMKSRKDIFSKLSTTERRWKGMDLQILSDINRTYAVLVSPDGEFLIESNFGKGKIPLDPDNPFQPDTYKIFRNISPKDHAMRYLGSSDS